MAGKTDSARVVGYSEAREISRDVLIRRRQSRRSDWSAGLAPAFAPGRNILSVWRRFFNRGRVVGNSEPRQEIVGSELPVTRVRMVLKTRFRGPFENPASTASNYLLKNVRCIDVTNWMPSV